MIVFYWNDDYGNERWVEVNGEFFVGRLCEEYVSRVREPRGIGVYMYWIDREHVLDMGINSALVSRKHMLVTEYSGETYIMDHGPQGTGSTNGTYLNGERMEPARKYPIKPGDNIRIGKDITILVGVLTSRNKPLLLINPGKNELPQTIVEAGVDEGVEVINRISDKPVYLSNVPSKPIQFKTPAGAIISNDIILRGGLELYTAIIKINKGVVEDGYRIIKNVLNNEAFKKALKTRCSSALKTFEQLEKSLVLDNTPIHVLTRLVEELVEAIKTDLNLQF